MHRNSTQALSDHQVGFFIALCCAHALCALPVSASVEWTGRIYDEEGSPVPSALITFFPESATHHSHATHSDSTGIYRLYLPNNSSGHVRIEALGYKPLSLPVDLDPSVLDFHLELQPLLMATLVMAAVLVMIIGRRLNPNNSNSDGDTGAMAAAVLITTLWVDGLFLLSALLQPGLSGLIE